MGERLRKTSPSREGGFDQTSRLVYHLATTGGDVDWLPVKCGGGIVFPNRGRVEVPESEVCPDCLKAEASR